jgi:hypothetical protein
MEKLFVPIRPETRDRLLELAHGAFRSGLDMEARLRLVQDAVRQRPVDEQRSAELELLDA